MFPNKTNSARRLQMPTDGGIAKGRDLKVTVQKLLLHLLPMIRDQNLESEDNSVGQVGPQMRILLNKPRIRPILHSLDRTCWRHTLRVKAIGEGLLVRLGGKLHPMPLQLTEEHHPRRKGKQLAQRLISRVGRKARPTKGRVRRTLRAQVDK